MQIYNNIKINSSFTHRVLNTCLPKGTVKNRVSSFITYILSFVLLFAGITKIIDPSSLIENLSAFGGSVFPFLSDTVVILISSLLPLIEICLSLLLIFSLYKEEMKRYRKIILLSTAVLFGIFFLYSVYGFILGNQSAGGGECGCFGNVIESSFGWGMIVRNGVLLTLSIITLLNVDGN